MSETDSEPKTKNDIYRDRNLLALAFIQAYRWMEIEYHNFDRYGWWPDTDDVNGEEWAVIWVDIQLPDELGREQVGWHIPREMVPDWMPKRNPCYDGYTTEEKNERLARYAEVDP